MERLIWRLKFKEEKKQRGFSYRKSLLYVLPFAPLCAYCYYLIEMFLDGVAEFCTPSTWEAETGNFP